MEKKHGEQKQQRQIVRIPPIQHKPVTFVTEVFPTAAELREYSLENVSDSKIRISDAPAANHQTWSCPSRTYTVTDLHRLRNNVWLEWNKLGKRQKPGKLATIRGFIVRLFPVSRFPFPVINRVAMKQLSLPDMA